MLLSLSLVSIVFAFIAQSAFADLNKCFSTVRASIRSCDDKFNAANATVNAASGQAMAAANNPGADPNGARYAAESQIGAADNSSAAWAPVIPHCEAQRRKCADDCNSVTAQEKPEAEKAKHDCFGKINEKIAVANQVMSQNLTAARGSASTGNSGGAQGAETLDGNIHRASGDGISNLDMLRRLQKTHDCSTSGAGNEAKCIGPGGTVYVPIGPGDAFRPFR